MKNALYRECDMFMINTAHEKITTSDIPALLNKAYVRMATMEKPVSDFRAAGIVPFNPDKFLAVDFAPSVPFEVHDVENDRAEKPLPSTSGLNPRERNQSIEDDSPPSTDSLTSVKVADFAPIRKKAKMKKSNTKK